MLITQAHYADPEAVRQLTEGLDRGLDLGGREPLFLCIGSDRHILDCFAPLIGTMLSGMVPGISLYGTLDQPLHAKNMIKELREIRTCIPSYNSFSRKCNRVYDSRDSLRVAYFQAS